VVVVNGKKQETDIDVVGEWLDSALWGLAPELLTLPVVPIPIPLPRLRPVTKFYFYWVAVDDPVRGRSLELKERVHQMGLPNVEILESARVSGRTYDWENHFGTITQNFKTRVLKARGF
jgi:hypothetical protein